MVSLSDVQVAFEEGGNLMIGVVGNTKHTDGGGCLKLESEGGREGVMCRVGEHLQYAQQRVKDWESDRLCPSVIIVHLNNIILYLSR